MSNTYATRCVASFALTISSTAVVYGQDYPNKPIRIITGGVGGSNDFAARLLAQGLAAPLGQQLIVDNRGGGVAPGEATAKAPPDGYTVMVTGGTLWTGPLLHKTPYDPITDFAPVSMVSREPNILVIHPSTPVKSVKELIALAKAHPGQLNYSYGSTGGSGQIAAELFNSMAGVKIQGISYKSDSQELSDLMGGYVQISFQGGGKIDPIIKAGKLRAIAVGTLQPTQLAPGLPTIASGGLPGFESAAIAGVLAPAKTPVPIITKLNQEIVRFVKTPDATQKFFNTGVDAVGSSPEEFSNKIKSEMAVLSKIIKDTGMKVDE